jgi:hypothetical protein
MVFLAGCGSFQMELIQTASTPTADAASVPVAEPAITPTATMEAGWTAFTHDAFPIYFRYPSSWQVSVETSESDADTNRWISITLRSDPPVETDEDRMLPLYPDGAYGIVITYKEYDPQAQFPELAEDDRQIAAFMSLNLLADGESTLVYKDYCTRLSAVDFAGFHGVDYIATLPSGAQASYWWNHNTVAMDSRNRVLILTGTPLNPPGDFATDNWRELYRADDERHQDVYRHVLATISVGG